MRGRCVAWIAAGVLVVLLGRTIGYAAVPSPLGRLYAQKAGGPGLPLIVLVALTIGTALATAICWLAALGVRERRLLERRLLAAPPPRLRPDRIALHALALWLVCAPAAGLLEAAVHWRAGLGWHGLHCLIGPVHRDLLPILAALSLVAAAVVAAAEHVLAWMRRTFALLRGSVARVVVTTPISSPIQAWVPHGCLRARRAGARAPPAVVV